MVTRYFCRTQIQEIFSPQSWVQGPSSPPDPEEKQTHSQRHQEGRSKHSPCSEALPSIWPGFGEVIITLLQMALP